MVLYADLAALINFLVDFLLLMASARLCGFPARPGRAALGAAVGGLYGGACLIPELWFLRGVFWRAAVLVGMLWLAWGLGRGSLRQGALFLLLSTSLGGLALGAAGGPGRLLLPLVLLLLLCLLAGTVGRRKFIRLRLRRGDRMLELTALQDTGNSLRDPLTGSPVLVIGPEAALYLTGLKRDQLLHPVEAMEALPGLQLVPYGSLGNPQGLLLAMHLPGSRIGTRIGNPLVAFAPDPIGSKTTYEALTGGII